MYHISCFIIKSDWYVGNNDVALFMVIKLMIANIIIGIIIPLSTLYFDMFFIRPPDNILH